MPVLIAAAGTAISQGIGAATSGGGPGGAQLPPNVPTSYSQTTTLPDYYTTAQQDLLNESQPGFNDATILAQHAAEATNPLLTGANSYLGAAANQVGETSDPSLNQDVFDSYMDPYTEGVVNSIASLGNQNLMENVLPGVNNTFTNAGQFGSDRNGEFEARAIRDEGKDIANAQAGALETGFNTSLGAYNTGEQRSQNAAPIYTNIANSETGLAHEITGEQVAQQGLDLAPARSQASIVNGMNVPTTINGTGQAPLPGATYGPSLASQIGSAATGLAGAVNSQKSSSPGPYGDGSVPMTGEAPTFAGTIKRGGSINADRVRRGTLARAKKRGGALSTCAA